MGKRGSATRPKDEDSMDIGPDSGKDTTDSEPQEAAKEPVEPLFKKKKNSEVQESDEDEDDAGEAKAKGGEEESADPCKVIVSQIPWGGKDKKEVFKIFDGCGEIVTHDMPPRVGIIVFDSEKAARKALKKDGTEFRGGKLKIRLASDVTRESRSERRKRSKAKAASKADQPAKSAAEGKKTMSKTRRSQNKKSGKNKPGEEGAAKDKKDRPPPAKDKKGRPPPAKHQKKKAMTREERRKGYSEAAKLGAKGRGGGQPFLGRGGGSGRGGGAGRGGGKPFAGRGGGGQDKKAAAGED